MVAAPKKLGRWATRKLNAEILEAPILVTGWSSEQTPDDVEAAAEALHRRVTATCDVAMPTKEGR